MDNNSLEKKGSLTKSLVPKLESMILEDNKEEEEDDDEEFNKKFNNIRRQSN